MDVGKNRSRDSFRRFVLDACLISKRENFFFFSLLSQLLLLFRLWQDGQQVTGSVVSLMRERS